MSSVRSWAIINGVFDINEFYDVIVEWFEETETKEDKKLVDNLLLWLEQASLSWFALHWC